jgi:hypothetical protein
MAYQDDPMIGTSPSKPRKRVHAQEVAMRLGAAMSRAILTLLLLASSPSAIAAQDFSIVFAEKKVSWGDWEVPLSVDMSGRLEELGICDLVRDRAWYYFHFVEFTGDGVPDLVYAGPAIDCERGYGEGRLTRFYQVVEDSARLVLQAVGDVAALSRPEPGGPLYLFLQNYGCCADDRVFSEWRSPESQPQGFRYKVDDKFVRLYETVPAEKYYQDPVRFRVDREGCALRLAPELDDESEDPLRMAMREMRGNVIARYPRGATGTAIGEASDSTGGFWLLVAMDTTPPPTYTVLPARDEYNDGPAPRLLGWMDSRLLDLSEGAR